MLPLAKIVSQRLRQGLPGLLPQPERRRGRRWNQIRIGQPGEIDHECAIRERLERLRGDPCAQPRLADPTRPGEGHQPNSGPEQERNRLLHLPLPPQERGRVRRQVVRQMAGCVERREVSSQRWMAELKDLLWLQDVAQAKLAQRLQGDTLGQCVPGQSGDGAAEQNLLTMGRVEETR